MSGVAWKGPVVPPDRVTLDSETLSVDNPYNLFLFSSISWIKFEAIPHNLVLVITSDTTAPAYGSLAYLVVGYQAELAEPI